MQAIFWICFSVLFYTYLGYGLLLLLTTAFFRRKTLAALHDHPPLTLIVPAYNEEAFVEEKIQNSLSLRYPKDKLRILFVTDGCTDSTNAIIRRYPEISLLTAETRMGKTAAINRAMQAVRTPFVVFTDANTVLHKDCLLKLMRHYQDETIGGVAGEKRIFDTEATAVGLGERLYWQYESLLKKNDAKFYTAIGAAGELFSIRTNLFQPVQENVILDDFLIWANVCRQGFRFAYDEEAYALETSSASVSEERLRKVRISAGCFQALLLLEDLLNPFKNPKLAFQYLSHRVLRWTLCPVCLPLFFLTNVFLVLSSGDLFYPLFLAAQILFYLLAFLGSIRSQKKGWQQALLVPYYFVFMNFSLCFGFYRFVAKRQTVIWQKARRKTASGPVVD